MDWDKLVQIVVNGLTLGSVYALVALGFSMVYGILKLLNFAHGDVLMVGAFIGWGVLGRLGGSLDPSVPVAVLIAEIDRQKAVHRGLSLPLLHRAQT